MKNFVKLSEVVQATNHSRTYGVGDCQELAASMAEQGQLQPAVISKDGFLAVGFRRFAAAKLLEWETFWAEVSDKTIHELKVANLVENTCRKDLTLWEEIVGIKSVFSDDTSIREIARQMSKSRPWVEPRVQAWTLPQEFLDQIRLNQVDIGRLRARLNNRKQPGKNTRYIGYPTQTEVRDAVTRLVEQGRTPEARALSYALGTITIEQLLDGEPEAT